MTIEPVNHDFNLYIGADFCIELKIIDEDGDSITPSEVAFKAESNAETPANVFDYTLSGNPANITVGTDDKITITAPASETTGVTDDRLSYKVDVTYTDGAVNRHMQGFINVNKDVA